MGTKEFVQRLDWSSAITAAKLDIEKNKEDADAYLYRGIAGCFIPDKEGKHKEAIDDFSKAIVHYSNNHQGANNYEAYYYRAYAYYLDGDYEKAIADCNYISTNKNTYPYKEELLGKIYYSMGKYKETVDNFNEVIKFCLTQTLPISTPCLLDSYNEACKKMNRV